MNLLAFVIWAVLGVGLGVLIRSQLGATLTGAGALPASAYAGRVVFFGLIRTFVIKDDGVWKASWSSCRRRLADHGLAERIAVRARRVLGPPWWVGALVLLGYGVVAGVVGTLITRRRDIS